MFKRLLCVFLLGPTLLFTLGCFSEGGDVAFESSVNYGSTKIVPLGDGVANGSSFLYVEIYVLNSDGSPVINFMPDLNVTDASVQSCTKTNSKGVARCAITSNLAGIKSLNLLNVEVDITTQAQFLKPVLSKSVIGSVPGSTINNTSGGHNISSSLSNLQVPLKYRDPSGHIVYSTVQGIVFSEE